MIATLVTLAGLAASIGGAIWASEKQAKYATGVLERARTLANLIKDKQKKGLDYSQEMNKASSLVNSIETDLKSGKFNNSSIQAKLESVLSKDLNRAKSEYQSAQSGYEKTLNEQQNLRDKYSAEEQAAAAKLNKDLVYPTALQNVGQTALYVGAGGFEQALSK